MSGPVVSVVIPTRGGAARLPVLLRALEAQQWRDFEIIPVVDGDIDGSYEVLTQWNRVSPLTIRPVLFFRNRGRAAALNAGFEAARGQILIRSDDDLEPPPQWVGAHVERHQNAVEPIAVIGPCLNVLPDNAYARVYGRAASRRGVDTMISADSATAWRHWSANVSLRRETFLGVGGYDLRYHGYGWEDVDYGYRLYQSGVPIHIAPELSVKHYMAATTTVIRALRALHSGAAQQTFRTIHGCHSIPTDPTPRHPWQTIVTLSARIITERSIRYLGFGIDFLIRFLPRPIAQKCVALLVESAGVAGIKYPRRASTKF